MGLSWIHIEHLKKVSLRFYLFVWNVVIQFVTSTNVKIMYDHECLFSLKTIKTIHLILENYKRINKRDF